MSPSPSSVFCREITPVLTRSSGGLKRPFAGRVGRAVGDDNRAMGKIRDGMRELGRLIEQPPER